MSDSRMTYRELADKVEWEGGVTGAIEYGIKPSQVPSSMQLLWADAYDKFNAFAEVDAKIEARIAERAEDV